ncbi:MAG: hypothetical protein CMF25_06380 [Kangiellaceae bacterium]|nr:hypothetical protein [Kangiellaceae bacterium]|tara:strand:- start:10502 stop:10918 length:417 start_codon:yes stop_codon:yes gene_type:complete
MTIPKRCRVVATREAIRLAERKNIRLSQLVENQSFDLILAKEVGQIVNILESDEEVQYVIFELGLNKLQTVGIMSWMKHHRPDIRSVALYESDYDGLCEIARVMKVTKVIGVDGYINDNLCRTPNLGADYSCLMASSI